MSSNRLSDGETLSKCIQLGIREIYLDFIINHYRKYGFISKNMSDYAKKLIKVHYKLEKYFKKYEKNTDDRPRISYYEAMLYGEFHQYGILTKKQIKKHILFENK